MTLRLLSYNVRSLRDDRAAVARVIRSTRPDVVCLQEAPRFLRWRSSCAALAVDSGLVVVGGGRDAGAMLLLARLGVEVVRTRNVLLSKAPGLHQRGLAMAVLRIGGVEVGVASMHLDQEASERLRHAPEVLAHVAALGVPSVLAGDVNETADEPAWQALAATLPELTTGVAGASIRDGRRIDAIFGSPGLLATECAVVHGREADSASDHFPLQAVVSW